MDAQLFETRRHYIFRKGKHSLWCSKSNGQLSPKEQEEGSDRSEEVLVGPVFAVFGKMKLLTDTDWRLVYASRASSIGRLPLGDEVYRVEEIEVLSLSPETQGSTSDNPKRARSSREGQVGGAGGVDKLEKRLLDALFRTVSGGESFFFSPEGDLTNTTQRRKLSRVRSDLPAWARADERFFWNKAMLNDLMGPNYRGEVCEPWIQPIVQGYVEISSCPLHTILNHIPEGLLPHTESPPAHSPPLSQSPPQSSSSPITQTSVEGRAPAVEGSDHSEEENPVVQPVGVSSERQQLRNVFEPRSRTSDDDDDDHDHSRSSLGSPAEEVEGDEVEREGRLPTEVSPPPERHPSTSSSSSTRLEQENPQLAPQPNSTTIDIVVQPPEEDEEDPRGRDQIKFPEEAEFSDKHPSSPNHRLSFHSGHFDMSMEGSSADMESPLGVALGSTMATVSYSGGGGGGGGSGLEVTFVIVSRRSWHRAGMRYKRRGADSSGSAANYVETEFITTVGSHCTSIVMVRGSVPILWSQPGKQYKPPPLVDQDRRSNMEALEQHFQEQLHLYDNICVVNTLNQTGQERGLSDAFESFLLELNSPQIKYVAFDFHRICHGSQQIQNVQILLERIKDISKEFRFCWIDMEQNTLLSEQKGVYRVNCMDCLDRTNVVQSYIAREVLLNMLVKLGLWGPDAPLPDHLLQLYSLTWANNGDAVSQQYAGTAAMKGDLTRHGERKLSGLVKDGYNSAYRYYLNLFSYPYRQAIIDLMLGGSPLEVLKPVVSETAEEEEVLRMGWSLEREEGVVRMVDHCRKQLYPYYEPGKIKSFALCEPAGLSFLSESDFEETAVLLLYENKPEITVANYDISKYEITSFVRFELEHVSKIEIGVLGNMLRNSRRPHLRLYYFHDGFRPTYFTFKTIAFASVEEDNIILDGIASELQKFGPHIGVFRTRIDRRRCPTHSGVVYLRLPKELLEELKVVSPSNAALDDRGPHSTRTTPRERDAVREAFSDNELLDCSDGLVDSTEEEEGLGTLLGDTRRDEKRDCNHSNVPDCKMSGDVKDESKEVAVATGEEEQPLLSSGNPPTGVTGQDRSRRPFSTVARLSPRLSPKMSAKLKKMRLKKRRSKPPDSRSRSPSPIPANRRPLPASSDPAPLDPTHSTSAQGHKTTAKEFFKKVISEQDSLSKLTKVFSKFSNNSPGDKEEEDAAEVRRRELLWKNSKIQAIII